MNGTSAGSDNLGLIYSSVPLVDPKTGVISRPWWQFFISLYNRVGGSNAPSNNELAAMINRSAAIAIMDDIGQDDPFILPLAPVATPITPQPILAISINTDDQEDVASTALSMMTMDAQNAQTLQYATWAAPLDIGNVTPKSGAFTSLSATTPLPITSGGTGNTTGTATINANLTGPITSSGNATSVASQTGTGTTFVMQGSPTLTTPNLGTPSACVGTNISGTASALNIGGNAATVTTNANLTGVITSVGNATSIASQTGTGNKFVVDTSPTLVTPNLGTPTTLVGTNISGTAASLTAGHVTTNADLTGPITSVGNATSIASQTGTGTKFVMDTSPTLVTPNLGTPTTLVGTNITGTASALSIGGNAATATTATNQSGGTVAATTISASSTITPNTVAGIVGTTLADNAQAGSVGERTGAVGSAVALTTATPLNVCSVLIQPGDWFIYGVVQFIPAATTPMTVIQAGFSTTSATFGGFSSYTLLQLPFTAGAAQGMTIPIGRLNISVATTLYLVASSTFTISTCAVSGALSALRASR